jgi:hypothetical protein
VARRAEVVLDAGHLFGDAPEAFRRRLILATLGRSDDLRVAALFVEAVGADEEAAVEVGPGRGVELRQGAPISALCAKTRLAMAKIARSWAGGPAACRLVAA